jgi:hypothetical protein
MTTKYDRRAHERAIQKLTEEIKLRDAIAFFGLKETLLALVDTYSLDDVERFVKQIAQQGTK